MQAQDRDGKDDRPEARSPRVSVCPKCGGPVYREHRRIIDRLISLLRPVRRYRCDAHVCQWNGLLPVDRARR